MNKSTLKIKFLAAFALLFTALTSVASNPDRPVDPDWTIHTSFDNLPRKIADTPDTVYFLVNTRPFFTSQFGKYLNYPASGIFFYDKKNPEAGMQDLAKSVNLSGFDIRFMEVDPSTGTMAIAYMDGGIDMISPDRHVTHFDILKKMSGMKSYFINAISFDPVTHHLWVSNGAGFIRINHDSLTVDINALWNENVSDIITVGDRHIAIIGNIVCEAPAGADIRFRDSFKSIANATTNTPLRLMNLSPDYFAYITAAGSIQQLALANNKWTRSQLVSNSKILSAQNVMVTNRVEHTVSPSANGYVISASDAIYQLNRPVEGGKPAFIRTSLPSGSTVFNTSYDLKKFWFYKERGKFFSRELIDGSWSEPSADMRPEAPLTAKDVEFIYSPEYGMLAVNRAPGFKSGFFDGFQPILVSAFKDGKWKNLAPAHNPPYYTDTYPAGLQKFNEKITYYPGHDPNGILIDPLHPEALHTANLWCGHAVTFLDDPRRNPIMNVSMSSNCGTPELPANKIFPRQNWGSFVGACMMGADADNNIWVGRSNVYPTDGSSNTLLALWAWTPEARKEAIENSDYTKAGEWKKIEVDTDIWMETLISGLALRHPKNKYKLLSWAQGSDGIGRALRVYNHNGTIEDTSDDRLDVIHYFKREDGNIGTMSYINCMLEDQVTGDVLLFTNTSLYIVDFSNPVENYTIPAKTLSVNSEEGNSLALGQPFEAFTACFDEYGRLWVGTSKDGVYGFSADRSKVIAHYNVDNSPIPSNAVFGIGWNPDTKSLFVSTDMAIVEVKVNVSVDTEGSMIVADQPFANPTFVNPEYSGTIAIYNIPTGATLRVRDAYGNTVADITDITDGTSHWNLLDYDGKRVPTGKYTITEASGMPDFKPITILVNR